ncbi:MAG: HD domain-containing protein [Chloroflexi bacterium]|nr:HD domain-containing protein [Chloroflexota bacterium]
MGVSSRTKKQVLIVDRDPGTARILGLSLQRGGFGVLRTSSAEKIATFVVNKGVDLVLLDVFAPEFTGIALRQELQKSEATRHVPILLLVDWADEGRLDSLLGNDLDYVTKPFDPGKVVAHLKSYLHDLPYEMDVNPLTELPGLRWIEHVLTTRLAQGKPFAVINVAIESLGPFRNLYGPLRAEQAIRILARILGDAVQLFGNEDDLVGHVGEDEFYIVSSPDRAQALCHRIATKFDDKIRNLYKQHDVCRGCLEGEYPAGHRGKHPIMMLSIGVTTSGNQGTSDPLAIRRIAAEVRRQVNDPPGSAFRFDRRRGDLVLEGALSRVGRLGRIPHAPGRATESPGGMADFAQFVTSKLRVPATIMHSTLDYLVQTGQIGLTPEQKQHLNVLQKHARRLADDVTELDAFYQIHQGGTYLCLQAVDIGDVIARVAEPVEEVARDKNVRLEVRRAQTSGRVFVDEGKLCQVLVYILCALIAYVPQGTLIEMDADETESRLRITLAVDNIDLAGQELVKVFRSFYRPRTKGTAGADDLGLGFHVAKEVLSRMGGLLTVRRRDRVYLILDIPKSWQSIQERAKLVQGDLDTARVLAEAELGRLGALVEGGEAPQTELSRLLDKLSSTVEQMALEATRAIYLVDEVSSRLWKERERAMALDAGFLTFLETLVDPIERRACYFGGHSKRVAAESFAIGQELRLPEGDLQMLYYAGLLHDVGMAAVPDQIVTKTTELDGGELINLQQHSTIGARLIDTADVRKSLVQAVLHHHERYDGTGYPLGLQGERIPIAARILAVTDAHDAMISNRPHRPALAANTAIERIAEGSGSQFDPKVVAAFLTLHAAVNIQKGRNLVRSQRASSEMTS